MHNHTTHLQKSRTARKAGLLPGTLIHIGDKRLEKAKITVFDYDAKKLTEKEPKDVEECFPFRDQPTITWINIDGLHDTSIIRKIGAHFRIHPLILEDILHTEQRPKFEDHDKYFFIVLRMLTYNHDFKELNSEQISFIVGRNYVISFQETVGDIFDNIRDRIRKSKGLVRKCGADYLVYTLLDAIVDNYFVILENMGEEIEKIEADLMGNPTKKVLKMIGMLKKQMLLLRKSVWPLREVINGLHRTESRILKTPTRVYFKDLYDHTIHVMDTIETYRDVVGDMLETYLSAISNKTNDIMKILTIFTTIFIPLTFLAGIYGMNFEFMPELRWKYGYAVVWAIFLTVGAFLLYFFRKKDWI